MQQTLSRLNQCIKMNVCMENNIKNPYFHKPKGVLPTLEATLALRKEGIRFQCPYVYVNLILLFKSLNQGQAFKIKSRITKKSSKPSAK